MSVRQLVVTILGLLTANSAFAGTIACSYSQLATNFIQLHIGPRYVMIAGWEHPGDELSAALDTLKQTHASLEMHSCPETRSSLVGIEHALSENVKTQNFMLTVLEASRIGAQISQIGMELTLSELAKGLSTARDTETKLNQILAKCGTLVEAPVQVIRDLVHGPELTFVNRHPGEITLLALEDETAKRENAKAFAKKLPFDDEDPRITLASQQALKLIWQKILGEETPSDDLVNQAVAFVEDSTEKEKLRTDLKASIVIQNERVAGAYKRNKYIARNILRATSNMTVVIGYSHVDNLLKQILSQCVSEP